MALSLKKYFFFQKIYDYNYQLYSIGQSNRVYYKS